MSSSPSWRMPIATPGTWWRDIPSRTRSSSSGRTRAILRVALAALARRDPRDEEAAVMEGDLPHLERHRVAERRGPVLGDALHDVHEPGRQRVGRNARDAERELVADGAGHDV